MHKHQYRQHQHHLHHLERLSGALYTQSRCQWKCLHVRTLFASSANTCLEISLGEPSSFRIICKRLRTSPSCRAYCATRSNYFMTITRGFCTSLKSRMIIHSHIRRYELDQRRDLVCMMRHRCRGRLLRLPVSLKSSIFHLRSATIRLRKPRQHRLRSLQSPRTPLPSLQMKQVTLFQHRHLPIRRFTISRCLSR